MARRSMATVPLKQLIAWIQAIHIPVHGNLVSLLLLGLNRLEVEPKDSNLTPCFANSIREKSMTFTHQQGQVTLLHLVAPEIIEDGIHKSLLVKAHVNQSFILKDCVSLASIRICSILLSGKAIVHP